MPGTLPVSGALGHVFSVEAARQGIRRCRELGAYLERVQGHDPQRKKIALAAAAHYLVRMMLAMLPTGTVCRWQRTAA